MTSFASRRAVLMDSFTSATLALPRERKESWILEAARDSSRSASLGLPPRRALSLARKPVWIIVAAAAVSLSAAGAALSGEDHGSHD